MAKKSQKLVATLNITVDGTPLTMGDEVDTSQLPAGSVESMVRLRQLVQPEEFVAEPEPEPEPDKWQDVPVTAIGLPDEVSSSLVKSGLQSVRAVLVYGAKHETLTSIEGVDEEAEKAIQAAITKLKPKSED